MWSARECQDQRRSTQGLIRPCAVFSGFNKIDLHTDRMKGASLVAQMVKNLHAMQETWAQSLGWEDALE